MGTAAVQWMEWHRELMDISINWGLEAHMKGDVDGFFGTLVRARDEHCLREWVLDTADLVKLCRSHFDDIEKDQEASRHHFFDFMPSMHKDVVPCTQVALASLPAKLQSCYSWRLHRVDVRRKCMVSPLNSVITGTSTRALLLPGAGGVTERTGFMIAVPLVDGVDDEAEKSDGHEEGDGGEVVQASDLHFGVQQHLGWRTSYRKSTPEDLMKNLPALQRRLRLKRKALAPVHPMLPASACRSSRAAFSTEAVERKRARRRREAVHFKEIRLARTIESAAEAAEGGS